MIPLRDSIPSRTFPFFTYGIIALNVLVFLYQISLSESGEKRLFMELGLKPGFVASYLEGEKVVDVPEERLRRGFFGDVERVVYERRMRLDFWNTFLPFITSMFLHGGIAHILGNMWFLHIFGDNVEDRLGHGRFLLFYLGTGVLASLAQVAVMPDSMLPTIGASGAISGVLGAYLITYPRARVMSLLPIGFFPFFMEIPAFVFLLLWFGLQVVSSTFSNPGEGGVAFGAHIGGFVAGMIAMKLIAPGPNPPGVQGRVRDVPFEIIER